MLASCSGSETEAPDRNVRIHKVSLSFRPQMLSVILFTVFLLPCVILSQTCPGACQDTSNPCPGSYQAGLCPGPSNIECCQEATPECQGQCQDNSLPCSGTYRTNECPGPANVQCCSSSGPPPGPPTSPSGGCATFANNEWNCADPQCVC
jgi:hypothetical protein